jgi:beta-glucosidase
MDRELTFPDGFLWGAATSAYQVEGGAREGGRGPSIWDRFCHAGRALHGDTGDISADHYHHLDDDLDLMAGLGLKAYRFSIAWPRVQPSGRGAANAVGLDFYRRLVNGLRERGIIPLATLYHFDLPQALEDRGGWVVRDTTERFAEYATIVGEALGDAVDMWITFNQPWSGAWMGYGAGVFPPGHTDIGETIAALHHQLLAHGMAAAALRQACVTQPQIGITLGLNPIRPALPTPEDERVAFLADVTGNRLEFEAVIYGRYREEVLSLYEDARPGFSVVRAGDLQTVSTPLDFFGLNYYRSRALVSTATIEARGGLPSGLVPVDGLYSVSREPGVGGIDVRPDNTQVTAAGWTIDPPALTEVLLNLRDECGWLPIYVTENGAACHDYIDPEGGVDDTERLTYLDGHVRAVHDALQRGVNVRGYFVWSLLDNFEWTAGYQQRFGLVFTDYGTQKRTPKASYWWYRDLIARNALT